VAASDRRKRRWVWPALAVFVAAVVAIATVGLPALARRGTTGGSKDVPVPPSTVVDPAVLAHLAERRAAPGGPAFPSPAKPQAPATVWAVGDGANGSDESRRLARTIAAGRPERVLYLGDVYETGTADEFRTNFDGVYGGLVPIMVPTPGNHEWANRADGYDPYWESITGHPTPHWFAITVGGWRVLSLNSEEPTNPAQLRFIAAQLAAARGRCIIATLHRPRENAGSHGDYAEVDPLWRRLRGRATLVLAGHDHNLQRMRPVRGTTQFVIGAGGRERYSIDEQDPRLRFGRDGIDGALRLRLRPGSADLAIISSAGRVLDRSSARCSG
jgi:Calcineurin-like phosphoesterase